jgi:starch synthase
VLLIRHPGFFDRPGLYQPPQGGSYDDNYRRFAFFSIGALAGAQAIGFVPEIVHLNDWQTGMAAVALKGSGYRMTELKDAKVVFTIHNLAYQGLAPISAAAELGLPAVLLTPDQLEFYGQLSFIKAGLVFADALTTVSPRYAQEIQTPGLGCELDGLLRRLSPRLTGILNGIDDREWNPATDPALPARYSWRDLAGKSQCKKALLGEFGLAQSSAGQALPLFGIVTRLALQKGIDILVSAIPLLMRERLMLVILGSGDPTFESGLRRLTERFPYNLSARIEFDPSLSHRIEGGSDFFLMPSRFEPCGLSQLYSLRYGAIPVVRATGGLDDTVEDIALPRGTGIKFRDYSADALLGAVRRARALYAQPGRLKEVRIRGMKSDFSWKASAKQYQSLFQSLIRRGSK